MQVIGKIEEIHDTVQRTETFSVREFVLEISSPSSQYSEHVLFQLTNNRTTLVDQFQVGQEVMVDFDLQGRKWTNPEGRVVFFNRLNAWRITPYSAQAPMGYQQPQPAYQQPQQGAYQPQQQGGYQQPAYQQPQPQGGYQPQPIAPQPAQNPAPQAPQMAQGAGDGADDLPF